MCLQNRGIYHLTREAGVYPQGQPIGLRPESNGYEEAHCSIDDDRSGLSVS